MNSNKLFVENVRLAIARYAEAKTSDFNEPNHLSSLKNSIEILDRVLSKTEVSPEYLAYGKANLQTMAEDLQAFIKVNSDHPAESVLEVENIAGMVDHTLDNISLSESLYNDKQQQQQQQQQPKAAQANSNDTESMNLLSYLAKETMGLATSTAMTVPLAYKFLKPYVENYWDKFKSGATSIDLDSDDFRPSKVASSKPNVISLANKQALTGELLSAKMSMKEHSEYTTGKNFLNAMDNVIDNVRNNKSEEFEKSGSRLKQAIDSMSDETKDSFSELSKKFAKSFEELNQGRLSKALTAFVNKVKELLSRIFSFNNKSQLPASQQTSIM